MAILETIKEAEAKATDRKEKAANDSKVNLEKAKEEASIEVKKMNEEYLELTKELALKNGTMISNKKQEIEKLIKDNNDNSLKLAKANMKKAVNVIIEKVLE